MPGCSPRKSTQSFFNPLADEENTHIFEKFRRKQMVRYPDGVMARRVIPYKLCGVFSAYPDHRMGFFAHKNPHMPEHTGV